MRLPQSSAIVLMAMMCFYAGCSLGNDMILEQKDTQFFEVKENVAEGGELSLIISGLAFHSGMSVSHIVSDVKGETIFIRVYLQPSVRGGSGRFEYEIIVSPEVSEAVFGENQVIVWRRDS